MEKSLAKIIKTVDAINLKICYVAMAAAFFLMCMTTLHAILRKFTSSGGIVDSLGITELSMTLIVFCGFAFMQSQKGHVRVDILLNLFPKPLIKALDTILLFVSAIMLFIMCYAVTTHVSVIQARHAATPVLLIPHWPFVIVIAVGIFFYALTVLLHAFEAAVRPIPKQAAEESVKEVDISTQM